MTNPSPAALYYFTIRVNSQGNHMNDKIQDAIRLLNEMEYEHGIEILKDVLTENPKNNMALYNLALAYNSINEPENAIKIFDIHLAHY